MIACTYIILSAHSFAKFYGYKNVMRDETAKFNLRLQSFTKSVESVKSEKFCAGKR